MVKIKEITILGIVSGVFLGLFFKTIESYSSVKVYTLLLNIDFIPILRDFSFGEWFEFLFHLLFSLLISLIYLILIDKGNHHSVKIFFRTAFFVTTPAIALYFPLVLLANKKVPQIDDISAIILWILGHLLYSLILGGLGYYLRIQRKT